MLMTVSMSDGVIGTDNMEESASVALKSEHCSKTEPDKCSSELSAHSHCNGMVSSPDSTKQQTAHDWEGYKTMDKDFYDDGTITFFWRAHRLTVLIIFSMVLIYEALWEDGTHDSDYNTKRGIVAVILAFVLFGVTSMPDGPFRRPHPALWRLMLVLSVVYELFLVFLLFQTVDDARQLMRHVDPELGQPLPEKSYGGNCRIYDHERPDDPFHNFWDKIDGFVTTHFFGWWLKTLILRDWWLCTVVSIMFEVIEYTLEHQLANFSECWWDHWLMDVIICNGFGIYLGMKTLNYLSMKPYHWRGMWSIPSYRGKLSRVLRQFTPYVWTEFDWRPTASITRWFSMLIIIAIFLVAELNTFTLKFVLWIPPPHFLCLGRLVFFLFWGAVTMREVFQFLDDPNCKKIGAQTLVSVAIIVTEVLITLKFDWETFTKPLPRHVVYGWVIGLSVLGAWTVWNFYVQHWFTHSDVHGSDVSHVSNGTEVSQVSKSNDAGTSRHVAVPQDVADGNEVNGGTVRHRTANAAAVD